MVYKLYAFVSLSTILLLSSVELRAGINPDLPLIELPADQVCAGVSYVHPGDMKEYTGTRTCVNLLDHSCTSNKDEACYVPSPYQAVAKSTIDPAQIKAGTTVAGVVGTLNLDTFNPPCDATRSTECQTSAAFPALDTSKLIPENIALGSTVLGVNGSYEDAMAVCSESKRDGCQVKSPYVAVDKTKLVPANIKLGTQIGGVEGNFPSADHPLAEPSEPDLTDLNFAEKISQESTFGFFDSAGHHYTMAGKVLDPASIASGVTIFNVTGTAPAFIHPDYKNVRASSDLYDGKGEMKLDCRNAFTDSHDLSVSIYPSVDDESETFANNLKWGEIHQCGIELWENKTLNNNSELVDCTQNNPCIYRNTVTGLFWLSDYSAQNRTHAQAKTFCANRNLNGSSGWRVPTHREMIQAYVHGIRYVAADIGFLDPNVYYWTSSSRPASMTSGESLGQAVYPKNGASVGLSNIDDEEYRTLCVR